MADAVRSEAGQDVVEVGHTERDHGATELDAARLPGPVRAVAAIAAGFGIGVVASIMVVAGGEPLIPTIVLL